MATNNASAVWNGTLKEGSGTMKFPTFTNLRKGGRGLRGRDRTDGTHRLGDHRLPEGVCFNSMDQGWTNTAVMSSFTYPRAFPRKAEIVAVEPLEPGGSLPIPRLLSVPNVTLEVLSKQLD